MRPDDGAPDFDFRKSSFGFVTSCSDAASIQIRERRPISVLCDCLCQWEKSGRVGPAPQGTVGEMRAAVYNQAESASAIKAFSKVASVTGIELAEAVLAGLKAGRFVVTYTALRGFIERTAHSVAIAEALKDIKTAPPDGPLTPVLECSEVIRRALYATQRDWEKLINADFRKISVKEVKYTRKENTANMLSENILNAVDKLDKRVPGTRLAYEILCEYLHPNVGDLWGRPWKLSPLWTRMECAISVAQLGWVKRDLTSDATCDCRA